MSAGIISSAGPACPGDSTGPESLVSAELPSFPESRFPESPFPAGPAGVAGPRSPAAAAGPAAPDHPWAEPGSRRLVVFRPAETTAAAGYFSWDMSTNEVMCEPGTHELYGLAEDGPATMETFLSRVPGEDRADVIAAMRQMMRSCGPYQIEYRVLAPDGSLRSMEARGRVLPGPDGAPARMTGFVMDTTSLWASREAERRRLHEGAGRTALTERFSAALAAAVTVDGITAAARAGLAAYGANGLIIVTEHDGLQAPLACYGFGAGAARLLGDPAPSPGSPVADAIAGETAVFVRSAADLAHHYPHLATVAAGSAHQAWAAVPVPDARGRLGACLMSFAGPREFGTGERALLVAASGLLAQSLQRARMHEAEHTLARDLQRGLLPRGPLQAPGMTIATRYQPVTSGLEIGGDFYDVIELTGGRAALVIGDVQGHNPIAASLMGRLRMVVHAYAREGHRPAEVMTRANQWLAELNADPDLALFATCCFVVIDPVAGELEMCRAGHPAPVLVSPGTTPVLLDQGKDLLLGVERGERYSTVKVPMPADATLLLATDGLLDADGIDPDGHLSALLAVLAEGAGQDLETLADRLLASPRRDRHGDDIALLIARADRATRPLLRAGPYTPPRRGNGCQH
jgi:serine phosphatase RsbU (regulator of sigma subunit)